MPTQHSKIARKSPHNQNKPSKEGDNNNIEILLAPKKCKPGHPPKGDKPAVRNELTAQWWHLTNTEQGQIIEIVLGEGSKQFPQLSKRANLMWDEDNPKVVHVQECGSGVALSDPEDANVTDGDDDQSSGNVKNPPVTALKAVKTPKCAHAHQSTSSANRMDGMNKYFGARAWSEAGKSEGTAQAMNQSMNHCQVTQHGGDGTSAQQATSSLSNSNLNQF
ncbi:hypothetical protein PM082_000086 [Marasmius tenuissimus]|nr:hypothetical protein PM082_000086 [Marasmius tenuissimus]